MIVACSFLTSIPMYSVPQGTTAVTESFGRFNRMLNPGFTCMNVCCGESVSGLISLRVQQLDVRVETKTKDNVFVNLVVSVQYQVIKEKMYEAFYRLTDSRSQVRPRSTGHNINSNLPRPSTSSSLFSTGL